MGADKNSTRRMNSVYAPNSQPKIPTHACQGRVVTTDLSALGTSPNPKQHRSATQQAKDLGNLQCLGWTVRMDQANFLWELGGLSAGAWRTVRRFTADCPKKPPEPLVAPPKIWTVHTLPLDHSRQMDYPLCPRGMSAKVQATKSN
jgi:hypothetical protein